jgi:hypothetical protein
MDDISKEKIIKALDNYDNKSLLDLDNGKIKSIKNDILQQLPLKNEELAILHEKLKHYRYVDNLKDIKFGGYVRWINLEKIKKIHLTTGGIIVHAKIIDNAPHIVVKNNMNRLFQFNMESCLIFQKMSEQESIILSVMDYLNK